jgi:hypothetical protein
LGINDLKPGFPGESVEGEIDMAEVKTELLPLLSLNNGVVLPGMVVTIPLDREEARWR